MMFKLILSYISFVLLTGFAFLVIKNDKQG